MSSQKTRHQKRNSYWMVSSIGNKAVHRAEQYGHVIRIDTCMQMIVLIQCRYGI